MRFPSYLGDTLHFSRSLNRGPLHAVPQFDEDDREYILRRESRRLDMPDDLRGGNADDAMSFRGRPNGSEAPSQHKAGNPIGA